MGRRAGASLSAPPAGVAKLADARDSKSREAQTSCGFDPHLRHHIPHGLLRFTRDAVRSFIRAFVRAFVRVLLTAVLPSASARPRPRKAGPAPLAQTRLVVTPSWGAISEGRKNCVAFIGDASIPRGCGREPQSGAERGGLQFYFGEYPAGRLVAACSCGARR